MKRRLPGIGSTHQHAIRTIGIISGAQVAALCLHMVGKSALSVSRPAWTSARSGHVLLDRRPTQLRLRYVPL